MYIYMILYTSGIVLLYCIMLGCSRPNNRFGGNSELGHNYDPHSV
jgi:hypothetical protein